MINRYLRLVVSHPVTLFGVIYLGILFLTLPDPVILVYDDWTWMPERAFFSSQWAWLSHLMFFSQNRLTWVGDFILARPGLFSMSWVYDFFRSSREIQFYLVLGVFSTAVTSLVWLLKKKSHWLLAILGGLYFVLLQHQAWVAVWPHLSGYILSGFFLILGAFWGQEDQLSPSFYLGLLFIFLSFLFHELATLGYSLFLGFYFLTNWRDFKKFNFWKIFFWRVLPFFLYGLILLFVAFKMFHLGVLFSQKSDLGKTISYVRESLDPKGYLHWFFVQYGKFILANFPLVPKTWISPLGIVPFSLSSMISIGFVVVVVLASFYRLIRIKNNAFLILASAFFAILIGIGIGRIAIRGSAYPWYGTMLWFFLIPLLYFLLERHKKWLLGLMCLLVLLKILDFDSNWGSRAHPNWPAENPNQLKADIHFAKAFLQTNQLPIYGMAVEREGSTGRVVDFTYGSENYALGMLLNLDWNERLLTQPTWGAVLKVDVKGRSELTLVSSPMVGDIDWNELPTLKARAPIGLPLLSPVGPVNLRQFQQLHHFTNAYLSWKSTVLPASGRYLHAGFKATEVKPVLYNFGLTLSNSQGFHILAFCDNVFTVQKLDTRDGQPRVMLSFESAYLSKIRESGAILLEQHANKLLIWLNGALLCTYPFRVEVGTEVGFITWENGTTAEELTELQWAP